MTGRKSKHQAEPKGRNPAASLSADCPDRPSTDGPDAQSINKLAATVGEVGDSRMARARP